MKTRTPLKCLLWLTAIACLTANPASAELIHRYSFNEAPGSTTVSDSVGTAHGAIRMTTAVGGTPVTFDGTQATLDGVAGYIDLPNGLVSSQTNITIEMWVTWTAGGTWARAFDFGNGDAGEDVNGSLTMTNGGNYIFFTPIAGGGLPRFTASDTLPGFNHESPQLNGTAVFPFSTETHVAITYGTNGARLFINGEQPAAGSVDIPLSLIQDVNVWLGRALYNDPMFGGSFNEFRMHNSILTLQQLAASISGGPTVTNAYDPGAASSLDLTLASSMIAGAQQTPQLSAGFANINGGLPITIYGADVTITSSAPNIVAVGQLGVLQAVAPGTATITARLGTFSDSVVVTVTAGVASMVHRYSFNEAAGAATVVDLVGGATFNASVIPPTTNTVSPVVVSNGQAIFPGVGGYQTAGYIDLPNGILSQNKTNVTFEFWFTWNGGGVWQRVFDFGNSAKGENPHADGGGLGYIMFTPARGGNGARTEFRTEAPHASVNNDAPANPAFTVGQEVHVVAIVAPGIQFSRLYLNGIPVATGATPMYGAPAAPWQLSQMVDVNNWLGMAQWNDPPLNGSINEFRIHEGVLTDVNVALSRKAGPNALPVANPGTLQSVSLPAPALFIGNPAPTQAALFGTFQNVTNVDISGLDGVVFSSSNTNIFTSTVRGSLIPRTLGTASLIANYGSFSVTSAVSVLAPVSLAVTNLPATRDAGSLNYTVPLLANFAGGITNIVVSAFTNGVTRTSSDTNVATITVAGVVTIRSPGTTTITSTYAGLTNQSTLTVVTPGGFVRGTLIHRYSFSGAVDTTNVVDSVGAANGELVSLAVGSPNNNFTGTGQVDLGGGPNANPPGSAYVNLPNGLISSLSSITIEGWVTLRSTAANQRFFDIGMSSGAPDTPVLGTFGEDVVGGDGRSYMFLSAATTPRFAIKQGTGPELPSITANVALIVSNSSHFAVVYDYPRGLVRTYINGQRAGTDAATLPLSVVDDRNNWLGRSQWGGDPLLNGLLDEFRIYNGPMLDSDVAATFAAGPNSVPVNNPSLSITLSGGNVLLNWSTNATGFALEGSGIVNTGYSTAGIPAPTVVGNQFQVSIPLGSTNQFYRLKQ